MLDALAADDTLVHGAAANQTAWMARIAEAAGGVVHRKRGATWMASRAGAVLAFPRNIAPAPGSAAPALPRGSGADARGVLLVAPADEAARARRGAAPGRLPRGLASALDGRRDRIRARSDRGRGRSGRPRSRGLGAADLPWDGAGIASVRRGLASAGPRRVWRLAAWRDAVPVGHATVSVTTGRSGVAGIYDMGVAANERRRGIGSALTAAALEIGHRAGCAIATLTRRPTGSCLPAARLPPRRRRPDVVALTT
jgi:ribosomal protein S18 acetylase RimI-like enzyme